MKDLLATVLSGQSLTTAQTVDAFELIMTGQATPAQIGALLGMLQQRGPTVEEITGALCDVTACCQRQQPEPSSRDRSTLLQYHDLEFDEQVPKLFAWRMFLGR